MSSVEPFLARTHIAYFSMELAIRPEMRTYAGGLGILAGDTARSCSDLELPVVFVTLLSRAGYPGQPVERKLTAIFAADIAGYSRLMAHDEVGTLDRLQRLTGLRAHARA
jgi:starch phosphorylase